MREFLSHYGLWAAFLVALLENDVAFIAIGVVAKLGDGDPVTPDDLHLYSAVPAAIFGALLHDTFWYTIGYLNSASIKSSKVYQRIGPLVERLADRFGPWEIIVARFIYGTRNPTSVFWGIHHLPYPKFAGIELIGLAAWGSLLVTIGFHCTGWAIKMMGKVEHRHHMRALIIAVICATIAVLLLRWLSRRRIYHAQVAAAQKAALAASETDPVIDAETRP